MLLYNCQQDNNWLSSAVVRCMQSWIVVCSIIHDVINTREQLKAKSNCSQTQLDQWVYAVTGGVGVRGSKCGYNHCSRIMNTYTGVNHILFVY